MRRFGRLISWAEAQRRLLASVRPIVRTEEVPVAHAIGRVAARTVRARVAVPPFDRATWDGYAVRSSTTRSASPRHPLRMELVGEIYAEGGFSGRLAGRQAAAVATGAALPPGADGVVAFEEVEEWPGEIVLRGPVGRGDRIARRGEDLQDGTVVVEEGALLAPADLGALAITGHAAVEVRARPVVAILPNGNELRAPGEKRLPRGAIYESNNASLAGLVEGCGATARPLPPVRDDPGAIERAIRSALRGADLVLLTGGSSVGERDHLPKVLPRFGPLLFHGIAIRPGKPTLAVRAGRKVLVGMPGHPTSCLSNGFWLLLPMLRKLAGLPGNAWREEVVELREGFGPSDPGFATVVPLAVDRGRARPTFRGSSAIASLGGANAFLVWPPGRSGARKGARVSVHRLEPPLGGSSAERPPRAKGYPRPGP